MDNSVLDTCYHDFDSWTCHFLYKIEQLEKLNLYK